MRAAAELAIPAGRYGSPAEFAAFLCGAPASCLTGSALRCDGGLVGALYEGPVVLARAGRS